MTRTIDRPLEALVTARNCSYAVKFRRYLNRRSLKVMRCKRGHMRF